MGVYVKGNRWFIDYYYYGKRKREVVGHVDKITRSIAEKALKARVGEIVQGKFNIAQTDKPVSVEELMDKYLKWAKDNHKAYERDISASKPLLYFFKGKKIKNLNLWHVEKYKSERRNQDRKPETINKELGILRRMFNLAIEWKVISSNPIKGIKLLKVPKFKPRVLKEDEFINLYNVASSHFKPILLCAFSTGMRKGEIIKLNWENVDLKDRYIHITETKNNESRSIPISDILFDALIEIRNNTNSEYVFTTPDGKAYQSNTAWKRAWNTALKKSGVGKCRFHDLRHTFVSNLIVGEKEDFATVMELSGHKDIRMLKRYSHTREEAKKVAISKLGKRLKALTMDTPMDTNTENKEISQSNLINLTSHN